MERPSRKAKIAILGRLILALGGAAAVVALLCFLPLKTQPFDARWPWLVSDKPLYHVRDIGGRLWAVPDPAIIATDRVNGKRFPVAKDTGAYRIFCIGQSTTEGFPFNPRGGYPEWLQAMVRTLLPGRRVEVVNAGASGSDSTRDLAIVREVLKYQPDLLVLYEGNNEERYARIRVGTGRLGRFLTAANLGLLRYFRVYRYFIDGGFRRPASDRAPFPLPPSAMAGYERNVREMIRISRRQGVRIVLLGQVRQSLLESVAASPENKFLRGLAGPGVLFVDAPAAFLRKKEEGDPIVPGLLMDRMHPSLYGQYLLALTLCRTLSRRGWIAPGSRWRWRDALPEKSYEGALGLLDGAFKAHALVIEACWIANNNRAMLKWMLPYLKKAERLDRGSVLRTLRAAGLGRMPDSLLQAARAADALPSGRQPHWG